MNNFKPGDTIPYLDYLIKYCTNSDGIVLYKETKTSGYQFYECHLGNYATLEDAQRAAVIYFMLNRPSFFSTTLYYRLRSYGGQYHEWYLFKKCIEREGLTVPPECTPGDGLNCQLFFNNQPLSA